MHIEYRSIADMNNSILQNLQKFPHDVDLIVGIPRSGMLPANLLAMYLNKPFTDLDSYLCDRIYDTGLRGGLINIEKTGKVLIMDDSICTGTALEKVKKKLSSKKEKTDRTTYIFGVVYATNESVGKIDVYCECVEMLRAFQWNIFHHSAIVPKSCFDIDGVLCPNPPIDDDGPQYINYIKSAPVLYKPSVTIDNIVSCRLEKYRSITEDWLNNNGIKYNKLTMLDFKTKEERIKWGRHGEYKGNIFKSTDNILFFESSWSETKDIISISKKPVFCTENFQLINHDSLYYNFNKEMEKYSTYIWAKDLIKLFFGK